MPSGKSAPIVPNRSQSPFVRKDIICFHPAIQGRYMLSLTNQGLPGTEAPPLRAFPPARSHRGVRVRLCEPPIAAARPLRRLPPPRGLRAACFAVCLRQGPSLLPSPTRGRLRVRHFGAPSPRATSSQRFQRPTLWGIRACVIRVARAVT